MTRGGPLEDGGGMSLTNCTITGNTAATDGGGLDSVASNSPLYLGNCTISRNQCGEVGGGIFSLGSPQVTWLTNTIVAGNAATAGADDAQISASGSNNLIGGDPLRRPWATTAARPRPWPCCPAARPSAAAPPAPRHRPARRCLALQ